MVRIRVSPQTRKQSAELPEFWQVRAIRTIDARGREQMLPTSLDDRKRFKPADIVPAMSAAGRSKPVTGN